MSISEDPRNALAELLPWHPIGFVAALGLGLYFTPIFRDAARRFGIVDLPDGKLKRHDQPVAYLGGLAVYIAFLISLGLVASRFDTRTLGLLLGGSIVLLLGLIDDLRALSPAVKLLGQLLAAFVLIKADIRIHVSFLPEIAADLVTVVWILTVTNAFNIIDVMDGLCAGVGAVCFTGLFAFAAWNGTAAGGDGASIALFLACLVGALLGFLRFNRRPAQIYLGDSGSMLIGFFAASIAMILSYTEVNQLGFTAPLFLLGIPLFDLSLVVVLRVRQGLSPFRGSPDHFAVRLKKHGFSVGGIVAAACIGNALLAAFAIVLTRMEAQASLFASGIVVATLIGAGWWIARVGTQEQVPSGAKSAEP